MADAPYDPVDVMPRVLAQAVDDLPCWFVIGGHAVRCLCPYRPSRDVDFGVGQPADLEHLLRQLEQTGDVEIVERAEDTVHLRWSGLNVSIFVLETFTPYVEGRRLSVTGILATKLHAIIDRGTRRDFFDLYVTLQHQRLGIARCLDAIQEVYQQPVNPHLLLRALTYFDDAEREAPLPGEGPRDWDVVKAFFVERVGDLLVPPAKQLAIQANRVDV